jgi:hypothetical protein
MLCMQSRRLAAIATSSIFIFCLLVPSAVYAQAVITTTEGGGAATESTPSVLVSQTPVAETSASQEDTVFGALAPTTWDWALRLLSAAFLSALGAWAIYMVFRYVTQLQTKYYDLAENLAKRGQSIQPVIVSASIPAGARENMPLPSAVGAPEDEVPPAKVLGVRGPNTVTVNVESPPFTAVLQPGDKEWPADEPVTWQIAPESAGTLSQTTGLSVRVTPKQVGAFQLIVKPQAATNDGEAVHFPVAVVAPVSGGISLPFVGEGWGTIVLAILFGLIIALLGLSRVLSTALIGTLLGALLGYIFGAVGPNLAGGNRRRAESGPPSNSSDRPGE